MSDRSELQAAIQAARLDGKRPAPTRKWYGYPDIDSAYEVQDSVLAEILRRRGGEIIGRKIGCTNQGARELLRLDAPFHGALTSLSTQKSPTQIAREDFPFIVLEPEFAFRLKRDIGPAATPHTVESVTGAIASVLPAIEIVSSCHEDWTRAGPAMLIADNGSSYGWVHGEEVTDWDPASLMAAEVALSVDEVVVARGGASNIDDGPLGVLAWLADQVPLKAGQFVSTGTTTDVHFAEKGEHVEAHFGIYGSVSIEVQ